MFQRWDRAVTFVGEWCDRLCVFFLFRFFVLKFLSTTLFVSERVSQDNTVIDTSKYPRVEFYLRVPPLVQVGTQSNTPQTSQIGYLLAEAMRSCHVQARENRRINVGNDKDRRNRPHGGDFSLGSVSFTVPENRAVVSTLP